MPADRADLILHHGIVHTIDEENSIAEAVAVALGAGANRVVVGTAAVQDPKLVSELLDVHGPERVVVGLDAVDGLIAVSGWTESTSVPATGLMARMAEVGVHDNDVVIGPLDRESQRGQNGGPEPQLAFPMHHVNSLVFRDDAVDNLAGTVGRSVIHHQYVGAGQMLEYLGHQRLDILPLVIRRQSH